MRVPLLLLYGDLSGQMRSDHGVHVILEAC